MASLVQPDEQYISPSPETVQGNQAPSHILASNGTSIDQQQPRQYRWYHRPVELVLHLWRLVRQNTSRISNMETEVNDLREKMDSLMCFHQLPVEETHEIVDEF